MRPTLFPSLFRLSRHFSKGSGNCGSCHFGVDLLLLEKFQKWENGPNMLDKTRVFPALFFLASRFCFDRKSGRRVVSYGLDFDSVEKRLLVGIQRLPACDMLQRRVEACKVHFLKGCRSCDKIDAGCAVESLSKINRVRSKHTHDERLLSVASFRVDGKVDEHVEKKKANFSIDQ